MKIQYNKSYSKELNREMEWKQFGDEGQGVLVIPSQDQRFYEWEDQGMIAVLSPMIESGLIHLICCDSIDTETWSLTDGDHHSRIALHERWFRYVTEELIPEVNKGQQLVVAGCSMGGYHAGNFFFRRPDLFDTVIALSGLYHSRYGFPNYSDDLTYANSPEDFLRQMPADHPWMKMYRNRRIIICIGQGRWEDETLPSTRELDTILAQKGVPAWFDYWGFDIDHDWPNWRNELAYFFNNIKPL